MWSRKRRNSLVPLLVEGFNATSSAASLIGVLVVVVLAASLLSTVALFVWLAQQNASMKTFISALPLLPLIVVFFVIGVVLIPIALIYHNINAK